MFGARPFSPETHGSIIDYVRERDHQSVDNLFFGPDPYFALKEANLLVPDQTTLRVNRSPIPDIAYLVDDNLRSRPANMSLMDAEEGTYDPREVLKDKHWSAHDLNFDILYAE